MNRDVRTLTIDDLRHQFLEIEFPEYQREPTVWNREAKQRLMDSILREFDIAAIYMYRKDDQDECIDGRQRLNAIMSFLGENSHDRDDNGFPLRIENEISANLETQFDNLTNRNFAYLLEHADTSPECQAAIDTILNYRLNIVYLSGSAQPDEFNLQFLRLNLGTLINAGEKLHAMVGAMRDEIFEEGRVGRHPFFDEVRIPGRRYSRELTGAQILLQAVSYAESETFTKARHVDLQRS